MIAQMSGATYDTSTGKIIIQLATSLQNGYTNTVDLYQSPQTLSMPLPKQLVDLDVQAATQMMAIGFNNIIKDTNYTIQAGEFTSYSTNWYNSTRNNGVEIQEANTAHIEHIPMGESTNHVIYDILQYIIELAAYIMTHTHDAGTYNIAAVPVVGVSDVPVQPIPPLTNINKDVPYINANKNLAKTGYAPYS